MNTIEALTNKYMYYNRFLVTGKSDIDKLGYVFYWPIVNGCLNWSALQVHLTVSCTIYN